VKLLSQPATFIYRLWYFFGSLTLTEHDCNMSRLGVFQNNGLYITLKQLSLFVTEKKTNQTKTLDNNNNAA